MHLPPSLLLFGTILLLISCGDDSGPTEEPPEQSEFVTATFEQGVSVVAGSPVHDNEVQIGQVQSVELTERGEACVTLEIEPEHAPIDVEQRLVEVGRGPGEPTSLAISGDAGTSELSSRPHCR